MTIDPAYIDKLKLTDLPAQRRAEYVHAFANREAAAAAVAAATKALSAAHAAHADLSHQAASHGGIGPADVAKVQTAIRDAEAGLTFADLTLKKAEAMRLQAEKLLSQAEADAYSPIRDAGIEMRIAAAGQIEALNNQMRVARAQFDHGTELLTMCAQRGLANGLPPGGPLSLAGYLPPEPSTEAIERKMWGWAPRQPSKGSRA